MVGFAQAGAPVISRACTRWRPLPMVTAASRWPRRSNSGRWAWRRPAPPAV